MRAADSRDEAPADRRTGKRFQPPGRIEFQRE